MTRGEMLRGLNAILTLLEGVQTTLNDGRTLTQELYEREGIADGAINDSETDLADAIATAKDMMKALLVKGGA